MRSENDPDVQLVTRFRAPKVVLPPVWTAHCRPHLLTLCKLEFTTASELTLFFSPPSCCLQPEEEQHFWQGFVHKCSRRAGAEMHQLMSVSLAGRIPFRLSDCSSFKGCSETQYHA
eukprot:1158797-Pelagomonas_calceolata.AAC.2